MFKGFELFILVCVFVIGCFLGGTVIHGFEKKKVIGVDSTTTVQYKPVAPVHDTIYRDSISVKRIPIPSYIHDTIKINPDGKKIDTTTCYSVVKDTAGAHIEAQICSDSFPIKKPFDLVAMINYQAPPEKIITVTLKTTIEKPARLFSNGWFWISCTGFLIAGVYAGHSLK
jgi:hypothetical protein